MTLPPPVAAVRLAVRRHLAALPPERPVVVACSGGADSLALLAATLFERRRAGGPVVGVTVDHALQTGSADRAAAVCAQMEALGADARAVRVDVTGAGGPEAAARVARYAALDAAADATDASAVLLGHTRDDQAETVLLGLARGSGARSLSGMAEVAGRYRRPLLAITRADTEAACVAEDLDIWRDPHNTDPAFARVRVRARVLPVLEAELGPGVAEALARTARLLRDDADLLESLAAEAYAALGAELPVETLLPMPRAVRRRVLRLAALEAGCPATELSLTHVEEMDRLLTDWRGQAGIDLPGALRLVRSGGVLRLGPGPVAG